MEEVKDEVRKMVEDILAKPFLDENDMAILNARRDYLTAEEMKRIAPVEEKVVEKKKK